MDIAHSTSIQTVGRQCFCAQYEALDFLHGLMLCLDALDLRWHCTPDLILCSISKLSTPF